MKRVKAGIKKLVPPTSKQAKRPPVTIEHMYALYVTLDLTNCKDAAVWEMACVAFWGCCRLGELLPKSKAAFHPSHNVTHGEVVLFETDDTGRAISTGFRIPWTKVTKEEGADIFFPATTFTREQNVPAYATLFAYETEASGHHNMTKSEYLAWVNMVWEMRGLPTVNGHSARIGGATELLLRHNQMELQRQISTNSLTEGFDNAVTAYETLHQPDRLRARFRCGIAGSTLTLESAGSAVALPSTHATAHPKVGKVGCIKSDGPLTYEKLWEWEAALSIIWSCHFQRAERGAIPFDPDDPAPRSVSATWFDVDVKPTVASAPGIKVLADWQQLLLAVPERCIKIVPASWDEDMFSQTFNLGLWGSDRVLSLWDTFSASPIPRLLEASPIVRSVIDPNTLLGTWREYDATLDLMYLLTNKKGQWIDELKSAFKADGWSISMSGDLVLDTEQTHVSMAVEMEIAWCVAVFVGNGWSLFTINIVYQRLVDG
ncbi:hypothetical protein B0H10DRAFT_1941672 [Mycena sp. CBHHK59/15]|nr:hypothetical protein B0H10DRAFT_1941672 [Mycena sp. CBHHK59/15]